jgi:hypothetical protein
MLAGHGLQTRSRLGGSRICALGRDLSSTLTRWFCRQEDEMTPGLKLRTAHRIIRQCVDVTKVSLHPSGSAVLLICSDLPVSFALT